MTEDKRFFETATGWLRTRHRDLRSTLDRPVRTRTAAAVIVLAMTASFLFSAFAVPILLTPGRPSYQWPPAYPPDAWDGQWNVAMIGAQYAWENGYRGQGIKVAIIDTGVDFEHDDLLEHLPSGINFASGPDSDFYDTFGHGTHIAGIVASRMRGHLGVAPEAEVYAVKALSDIGYGRFGWVADAIDWTIENDMDIVSMSFGTVSDVGVVRDAVQRAHEAGIFLVGSAGNRGWSDPRPTYPAAYPEVMAVGAVDFDTKATLFTSAGGWVEIAAPGYQVLSSCTGFYKDLYYFAKLGDLRHCWVSGTSMAAPHVAGAAAVMLSSPVSPAADLDGDMRWSAAEVRAWLIKTAWDVWTEGWDAFTGHGIVDLTAALGATYSAIEEFDPASVGRVRASIPPGSGNATNGFLIT